MRPFRIAPATDMVYSHALPMSSVRSWATQCYFSNSGLGEEAGDW